MTVYSTTINTSMGDAYGNRTTTIESEVMNEGHFISEADLGSDVPTVIDGKTGGRKAITDASQLADNDRITVDGIPMTVAQARQVGIAFKVDASAGGRTNTQGIREVVPQADAPEDQGPTVDVPVEYTSETELLAGQSMIEATQFHTGLDQSDVEELGADIALGEIGRDDPLWRDLGNRGIPREAATRMVDQGLEISRTAARQELGSERYAELQRYASQSKTVRSLLVQHGIKRMNGTAKLGWGDVLSLARQHVSR